MQLEPEIQQLSPPEPDGKSLEDLRNLVRDAYEETFEGREFAERCWAFYHSDHWTEQEKQVLRERGQEPAVANLVRRKVNFLRGLVQRTAVDPEANPITRESERSAHVASDILKHLDSKLKLDAKRAKAGLNMAARSFAAAEVVVRAKRGADGGLSYDPDVVLIDPDEFFYDPRSREEDFSDAAYLGVLREMDVDAAQSLFPGIEDEYAEASFDLFRPITERDTRFCWGDRKRRRVRVAQVYYLFRGQWRYAAFVATRILQSGVSAYPDADGMPHHPYVAQSVYVTHKLWRYGPAGDLLDPQREYNRRRSRILYDLLGRKTFRKQGSVPDAAAFKAEVARPNGDVVINDGFEWGRDIGFVEPPAAAGQFQFLAETRELIEAQGPNSALMGRVEGASGRAIEARQNAGMTEEDVFTFAVAMWTQRLFEALWARVRTYMTDMREIAIVRDNGEREWVAINQPVPAVDPMTGQPAIDPFTGQPVIAGVENELARLNVDIVVALVADATTNAERERERLLGYAQAGVPIPPQVVIETSGLRNKDRILKLMIEQMQAAAGPQVSPEEQEIARARAAAEVVKLEADARQTNARTDQMLSAPDLGMPSPG